MTEGFSEQLIPLASFLFWPRNYSFGRPVLLTIAITIIAESYVIEHTHTVLPVMKSENEALILIAEV